MICTSSYKDCDPNKYNTVSISGDHGKMVNYKGNYYSKLAPRLDFWKIWHSNIDKISKDENTKYYIREYWNQVLSKLDPFKTYEELNNSILLCYEESPEFCHRHIVSAWFELFLNVKVPDIKIDKDKIIEIEKPEYIKEYLEQTIKQNKDMKGFTSLRALYLYEREDKSFSYYAKEANTLRKNNCEYKVLQKKK